MTNVPPTPRPRLAPAGALDAAAAEAFTRTVADHLAGGRRHLLVVLDDVTSFDPSGLRALAVAAQEVRRQRGTMRVLCTQERLLRVLRVTGLHKVLDVRPDDRQLPTAG